MTILRGLYLYCFHDWLADYYPKNQTLSGYCRKTCRDMDVHCISHLLEGVLGLVEEIIHYAFAEVSLIFVIVHLKDLLEGWYLNHPSGLEVIKL